MKIANKILLALVMVLVISAILCDLILAREYKKVDLSDRLRNFKEVAIKPFKVLNIRGGNGYAIQVRSGSDFNLKLLKSRKSFFKKIIKGDTLQLEFAVANQTYQSPEQCATGMIITMPTIAHLAFEGVNARLNSLNFDSCSIYATNGAYLHCDTINGSNYLFSSTQGSKLILGEKISINKLRLQARDRSIIKLDDINCLNIQELVDNSSELILSGRSVFAFTVGLKESQAN